LTLLPPTLALLGLALLLLVIGPAAEAGAADAKSPARFSLTFDVSGARAILAAATSEPSQAAAAADAALKLPGVQALISKEHKYFPKASAESFKADVIAVASGRPTEVFPLKKVRDNPAPYRQMLALVEAQRPQIVERLSKGLQSFTPDGMSIDATMVILLGTNQHGWVPEQKSTSLYVDIGWHLGDIEGLLALGAHELFHVVQGAIQPDWIPILSEPPKTLPAEQRRAHRVHAAIASLVMEGMAAYVGDPVAWGATRPGFDRDKREYERQLGRADEIFALFDTLIYRFSRDDDAPLDALLNIGFGGSWEQTGYYVGYRMAQAIDRHRGRDRLRALVLLTPEEFVRDYIAVARSHPEDSQITPLASSTIAVISPQGP